MTPNQIVFITGASAGIGEALLRDFHRKGWTVVGYARRSDRLQKVCNELNLHRPRSALAIEGDVNQPEQLERAVQTTLDQYGKIDGFIANAGFGVGGVITRLSLEDYRRQFETNVFAVIKQYQTLYPHLKNSRGFFTVVGSVNSYLSLPTASAYTMSKFSIRAFTEAAYWEAKADGISVTLACPGFVKTEIRKVSNQGQYNERAQDPIPTWLMMPADRAAAIIARASLARKKEVIVTLHGKILVWIQRHCPGLLAPLMKSILKSKSSWSTK